jgi:hypothetical protein
MKFKVFIVFQFLFLSLLAQNEKPRYYYDENELQISEEIFYQKFLKSKENGGFFPLNFENDTCYYSILFRRKKYGKLIESKFDSLQLSISDSIYKPKNKYSVIQYQFGATKCNNNDFSAYSKTKVIYNRRPLKKIKNEKGIDTFWIYGQIDAINYTYNKHVKWKLDNQSILKKLFFQKHQPCSGLIVINNFSKNFLIYFGEYGKKTIIEYIKEFENLE